MKSENDFSVQRMREKITHLESQLKKVEGENERLKIGIDNNLEELLIGDVCYYDAPGYRYYFMKTLDGIKTNSVKLYEPVNLKSQINK